MAPTNPKILVVEDSPTQAENLKLILEGLGYRVTVASNGLEALKKLEQSLPDLILSDIVMPGMDGYTFCKTVKSDSWCRAIPVVLLSGLSDAADVLNGLASGADNFLSKPVEGQALSDMIGSTLARVATEPPETHQEKFMVSVDGASFAIEADPGKIVHFLMSSYQTAIQKNRALEEMQKELGDLNRSLESKVAARTAELANEIEERKRAELNIREREQVIREITTHLTSLVFKTDAEGIYLWINPAHSFLLGYTETDLLGHSLFEFIHPEDQETIRDLFHRFLKEEVSHSCEYKFLHSQGHYVWMECTTNYIHGTAGSSGSVVFAAHEITRRKDFENELIVDRDKAMRSDWLKSSFLANMSHDIRTPMNAIIGFSELLKETGLTETDRMKFLDQISKNGESLLNLVNDIIDVSKIEAGVLTLHEDSCAINHIFDELYEFYNRFLELKGKNQIRLAFSKGFGEPDSQIITDPLRFRQIMSNLLTNAAKFTDTGKIEFGYDLSDEQTLRFFVRDTGVGIPREEYDRIFDQYSRVEKTIENDQGGTGLGLTISRNLVMLMGGKMWVESQEGKGSCFYFTLPYHPVNKPFQAPAKSRRITDYPDLSDRTILIVEDDHSSYSYLVAILNRMKTKVLWAKEGQMAIDMCRTHPEIDLVLLDIQVPKLTGFEITPIIKQERPELPVIAQTAYTMSGEEQKCYEAGCDDYLAKPILPGDLVNKICHFLERQPDEKNT